MKLMIMPESTKIRLKSGMLEDFEERVQSRRVIPTVQFHAKNFSKKTQVKVEWSIHSSCNYPFWSNNTENQFWR